MATWWILAATAVVLIVGTGLSARRPAEEPPDHAGYIQRWRRLHGGYDPASSRVVSGWLAFMFVAARPFAAAGVSPNALTMWMPWVAGVGVALAGEGGRWPLLAAFALVLSAVGDGLDGAVAVLSGRTTRWGYVLDSVVDRVSDLLYLAAFWVLGAPGLLVACTGFGVLLLEYVRARGNNAGAGEIGIVTVGERPSRVIAAAATVLAVGVVPDRAEAFAVIGAAVLAGLTAVSLVQLLVVVRRSLMAREDPA